MRSARTQGGFTLVEIAIVMVIIGLLLGGALKGQQMIENARIKRVKSDFDQYVAAIYAYQDIYRSLPGDNSKAEAQHGPSGVGEGDGDAVLEGNWNSSKATDESALIWAHLRAADLITGNGSDTTQPQNAFSGSVGIETDVANLSGLVMCFGNISNEVGRILDNQYDDGNGTTGTINGMNSSRVAVDYTAAASTLCFEV